MKSNFLFFYNFVFYSFIFSLFLSCSSWKKSQLVPEVSWSNNSENFLTFTIFFEETSSWNPLEGTTIKRNFTTNVKEFKINAEGKYDKISEFSLPYWVLSGNFFFNGQNRTITLIRGTGEGYGTPERGISFYSLDQKKTEDLWAGKPGQFLWKIVPSPDASKVAFITTDSATSDTNAALHIWDKENSFRTVTLNSWIEASPEYALSWNKDSATVFVSVKSQVFSVGANTKELKLTKSNSFPKCFIPSTSYGFAISPDGKKADVDPIRSERISLSEQKGFLGFEKIPKVSTYQNPSCLFPF